MSASHMSLAEYLSQKTYQILCFFCILLKFCKRRNGTVWKVENDQYDKNWFYQRTSEHFKMFTKLILQLKSDQISFTVLMIQLSSDCRWK